jgi:HSP20 family protein
MTLAMDPFFRDLNRMASEVFGSARAPQTMPLDAYRSGDHYVVELDLPGIDPDSLEVHAENNTLTVRAHRDNAASVASNGQQGGGRSYLVSERPRGTFSRQLSLGDGLDLDNVRADYTDGVLTVTLPVAEQAKPRKIEVGRGGGRKVIEGTDES